MSAPGRALRGTTVIDASRMLPGAVLARMLLDLGARLVKVEAPGAGDPMRSLPPLVDGVGAGFCAFFRGAESICLDLKQPRGAAALCELARHGDVLVESFRPGMLETWGAGPARLAEISPSLVLCSLSGFHTNQSGSVAVGHDVNFVASSGLLSCLPGDDLPRVQLADVTAGILACSAVLAALLDRQRTGRGLHVRQPLFGGPFPFLTLALANAAAGDDSRAERILSGGCPAYRLYRCNDGLGIAVGALEPKFWAEFAEMLGLPEVVEAGLELGSTGEDAARSVQQRLATRPRDHWLALARERNLPVTPVHDLEAAIEDPTLHAAGLIEETPAPGGATLPTPGPYLPSVGATPSHPAPRLGEHTERILREFGIE
jgi:crotonobetainyl-CoA:carnitine CoA-transferase CaiB-like acyl-CoA transferase